MFTSEDARRRWFGILFLILAGGMLIWGETVFRSRLRGVAFIAYWLVCFVFVMLAMVTALLDLRAMRRRTRDQQRDLFQQTLEDIKSRKPGEQKRKRSR